MTQHELVIEYIREYGSIIPAKMAGFIYKGVMMGSETSKRCRELRNHKLHNVMKYPILDSCGEGKFEKFYLKPKPLKVHIEVGNFNVAYEVPVQIPQSKLNL